MAGMFFKVLFRAMVLIVIVLGGLSYLSYLQGRDPVDMLTAPFRSMGVVKANSKGAGATTEHLRKELNTIGSLTKVYRWRDADGNQYFGDRPPEHAAQIESMEINPDTNLILGLTTTRPRAGVSSKQPTIAMPSVIDNPYKPERIKQLFDDAKQIQRTLNQRYRSQQEVLRR